MIWCLIAKSLQLFGTVTDINWLIKGEFLKEDYQLSKDQ